MNRIKIAPRQNWQKSVEQLGFGFHSTDIPYWDESAYYEFSSDEIEEIESVTNELYSLCIKAVQHVIDKKLYDKFLIPKAFIPFVENSWENDHPSIYGRFDLAIHNGAIKMLEFNADTPTSIYEAGIVQWFWLKDFDGAKDQFNSIHDKLIAYWSHLKDYLHQGILYFGCVKNSLEDLTTVEYIRDCAIQAGIETQLIFMDEIGWDENTNQFLDLNDQPIRNIFKLYPYEWMIHEDFGASMLKDINATFWIEPSWKMILSNKAILPLLWELFPNHPNLLKAYYDRYDLVSYAKKPLLSREGANVELVRNFGMIESSTGEYGAEGFIYQELFDLPCFDGNYPVIGSWIIGQEASGIGIRESTSLITNNQSRFVPHLIN
jgi:glutathionylspermidine synthase